MKNISKILSFAAVVSMLFTACSKVDNLKKVDALPVYQQGVSPVLTSSVTTVAPALADSNNAVVNFSWTNPKYANDSSTTKYLLEIDSSGGSFGNAQSVTVNGALGTALTGRQINGILLNYGYATGVAREIQVRVISSYANNNERYMSNVVKLTATPFVDPSKLTGSPASVVLTLATASAKAIDFSWSQSFIGYTGKVTYVLEYDSSGKSFAAPMQIAVNPDSPYIKWLTQGQLNAAALGLGVVGGTDCKLDFRVKGTTAAGAVAISNKFSVAIKTYFPVRRFYMPGAYQSSTGNGTDWDPPTAPELIRDLRPGVFNDMYYIYIYMPAGKEFKFTQGRSWDINFGGTGGTLSQNGANLSVATSGFYRITINATTLKYDIREGRMGFVGGATGAGWNPPGVFPTYALGNAGTNLFVGLTDFTADGWKLIDSDSWNDGSKSVTETRSYGATGASGTTMEINGGNFPNITTAGRYRVIWDGRDRDNITYNLSPATEMRVVGDGIQGVAAWTPGVSPQMTYMGNGIWKITIALIGGKDIKFLAGNDWGAFDYEDNSGGSTATGTARAIKWEGGNNFKTPAASGTYTITLDENKQTVTIN